MRRFALALLLLAGGCSDPIEVESKKPAPAPPQQKRADPPPPIEKPPPHPVPESKKPDPIQEPPVKEQKLAVEAVELSNPDRLSHGLLAFAANADHAQQAFEAHRSFKKERIEKLPPPTASEIPSLYLVWGHFPKPSLKVSDLRAALDPATGRIRVTLPAWSTETPKDGIGMDWRSADRKSWTFVGYRVRLSNLPPGEYAFEVLEQAGTASRTLAEGKFTLAR